MSMNSKTKIVKKGYETSSSNFIALGSRKNSETVNAATALDSAFSSATVSTVSATAPIKTVNSSTQNSDPKNGSKNTNSSTTISNSSTYLDPKTIKEEIIKALEKEDSPEKVVKLIKLIIINLKTPNASSNGNSSVVNKQQQQQQQQPDLNFLMALSYVALKKPQVFLKNSGLVDVNISHSFDENDTNFLVNNLFSPKNLTQFLLFKFLCTNLLFTSKLNPQDKLSLSGSTALKSKLIRPVVSPQPGFNVQPTICSILNRIFENETSWPEIFIKAYFDDSLGERTWVDNPSCKDFVQNIVTAFDTKPIPFSADNNNVNATSLSGGSANDLSANQTELQCEQISLALIDSSNHKSIIMPRYTSIRSEIEVHLVDLIRNQLNSKHQQANQRILGQTNSILQSSANTVDNRNFLKLLQSTSGFCEVRAIALSKLEGWLVNPKLTSHALDLLLSICVNCNQGDQADKDLIAQIIKFKPKIKQQQHYFDCIRELIKQNASNFETLMQLTVMNELTLQQQYLMQHQSQQQQQLPPPRNQHNLNLLQNTFATDCFLASKIFAQIMQTILLQRNSDDYLRLLRSLLRDTIRNSRQDFDLLKFTKQLVNDDLIKMFYGQLEGPPIQSFLFNLAGGLADFNSVQIRERYANGICDLITVCILVAITPTIKEAYQRRTHETKEILIKYYMCMSQIQSDTVTWLQSIVVNLYKISPTELIRCMFKVLFMVDKPEQCYTIDNWPSEQERGTMFRVVSEIPVLSETLHQVLMITKSIPDHMFMLMLCVEENLLKIASLVHNKDIYSLKLNQMDQFIQSLFSICQYTYQNPPNVPLAITALYWRAWQILLIITALDPKGFGLVAWEQYPTLRLLMEMVMTDDYSYPPQSSITDEMSIEQFRNFETQASSYEKQEILEFENCFELKQGSKVVRTEMNSKLIGQVMKFDPTGCPRRPTNDTIQNIRKLNSEYKLGQLLCKSRQPDFLLRLIKGQSSEQSLPWLSTLIESSTDCLEIMPIQCVCEFVWNFLVNTVEELPLKKQINIEQLIQRLKHILISDKLSDSYVIQQINDTFDYFLNKLCSDKFATRMGALRILYKLFISTNNTSHIIVNQQQATSLQQPIDLNHLIEVISELNSFTIHIQPLFMKYFRRALMVETNPGYLMTYLTFLIKQAVNDYQQQYELEASLKMQVNETEQSSLVITNKTFKDKLNEISIDLANFFFQRPFCFNSIKSFVSNANMVGLAVCFAKFAKIVLKVNEYELDNDEDLNGIEKSTADDLNIRALLKLRPAFSRESLDKNSFLLIKVNQTTYQYIHEKNFNLVVYILLLITESLQQSNQQELDSEIVALLKTVYLEKKFFQKEKSPSYLNCEFNTALNSEVVCKMLRFKSLLPSNTEIDLDKLESLVNNNMTLDTIETLTSHRLIQFLIKSIGDESNTNNLSELFDLLLNKFGMSSISSTFILTQIDCLTQKLNPSPEYFNKLCETHHINLKYMIQIVESLLKKSELTQTDQPGCIVLEKLSQIRSKCMPLSEDQMQIDSECEDDDKLSVFSSIFNKHLLNQKTVPASEETKNRSQVKLNDFIEQNEYSMACLKNIEAQIEEIKMRRLRELDRNSSEMVYEDISQSPDTQPTTQEALELLIKDAKSKNLEKNMNSFFDKIPSNNERILVLAETILKYENGSENMNTSRNNAHAMETDNTDSNLDAVLQISTNRCTINMLLDYIVHLDPQIINKELDIEHRLLFEMRKTNDSRSFITQSYLLSLFIHQAGWQKLFDCAQYLFSSPNDDNHSNLNPTVVLDFLSSLLYIPELWKGTESKAQNQLDRECILNLNEKQICNLLDFIVRELCLVTEIHLKRELELNKSDNKMSVEELTNNFNQISVLKVTVNKRVKLLKYFLKSLHLKRSNTIRNISIHLERQKRSVFVASCFNNQAIKEKSCRDDLFNKIQSLLIYNFYLEENSVIEFVSNPNRLFSDYYSQIDIPTSLDVKAHNLLNCFGEIDVNYSQNATSSGTIGVSSIAQTTYKKKEKEEVVQFAKKQEVFMMDANLLCIKLASTHPFIFIRQIPMMEGLLQGRVVFTFDEFKRRKLDKLFHYIIDLLTIMVPYIFKYEYFNYIESIVSHYFDVFKSYCSDNREANGSLVQKFFDFFEKFVNTDIQVIYERVIKKHSSFISYMYKLYPDINSLKFVNGMLSMPFDSIKKPNEEDNNNIDLILFKSLSSVNLFQKSNMANWTSKQLEPFTSKIINRDNYDGVLLVLQELDTVSQRQPKILSYFVFYLQPLMQDPNDTLRDTSISLIMRYLRLNPKETSYFCEAFIGSLTSSDSKIFNSAMKSFADFVILCSEKSNDLLKYALKGASKHNVDISKTLTDAIRLLTLEKYVY